MASKKPLRFKYRNWQGKVAVRIVIPIDIWYGSTEWHKEEQWLLKARDLDKDSERDFAIKDILSFVKD